MSIEEEIRRASKTGKLIYGYRECEKNILKGNGKLLIFSNNIPEKRKEKLSYLAELSGIPTLTVNVDAIALGAICGRPHSITTMLVMDPGKSKILKLVSSEQK